jgi:hypothetical protein
MENLLGVSDDTHTREIFHYRDFTSLPPFCQILVRAFMVGVNMKNCISKY